MNTFQLVRNERNSSIDTLWLIDWRSEKIAKYLLILPLPFKLKLEIYSPSSTQSQYSFPSSPSLWSLCANDLSLSLFFSHSISCYFDLHSESETLWSKYEMQEKLSLLNFYEQTFEHWPWKLPDCKACWHYIIQQIRDAGK